MINIKLLHEKAKIPTRGSSEAAGLDLYTVESATIKPGVRALLHTGIAISIPDGYVGLIWPRSKLAAKMGIDVLAGVIDSDYRAAIMISLLNTGKDDVEIQVGDKVAQMIIQNHTSGMGFNLVDNLSETIRASSGINSAEMRIR